MPTFSGARVGGISRGIALPQGLFQVGEEVGGVFETDGDAHSAGFDAGGGQLGSAHLVVRSVNRQHDKRLDSAQRRGQEENAHAVADPPRRRQPALHIERQHRAEAAHLQPLTLRASSANGTVLDFTYCFNATVMDFAQGCGTSPVQNNGNVVRIVNNRAPERSQRFVYDALNRIRSAQTQATTGQHCWGETFGYDVWANLLSIGAVSGYTGCTQENLSVSVTTKNQISGYCYDAAGNLIIEGVCGPVLTYTYDAENRMTATAGVSYSYDGDGRRVMKSNGKLYWNGTGSDALAETDLAGNNAMDYVFFGGKRIARRDASGAVFYYFADHLGSSRVVTNSSGGIVEDSDYYPFGGERVVVNNDPNPYKFTGKERDTETNLDYFVARYYSSGYGRFLSPDPLSVLDKLLETPQDLNLYTYTINNPLRYFDPNGEDWKDVAKGMWEGTKNFVSNTASGVKEVVKNPTVIVTGTIEAVSVAGKAYFTSDGRQQMAAQWNALDTQAKTEIVTEALLRGGLAAAGARMSGATRQLASKAQNAIDNIGAPNPNVVVRGGTTPLPEGNQIYSGAQGATLQEAAGGVPHGQIRVTTAGEIRQAGGRVRAAPEPSYPGGPVNPRHVNIQGGQSAFGPVQQNPVPRSQRVPSRQRVREEQPQ